MSSSSPRSSDGFDLAVADVDRLVGHETAHVSDVVRIVLARLIAPDTGRQEVERVILGTPDHPARRLGQAPGLVERVREPGPGRVDADADGVRERAEHVLDARLRPHEIRLESGDHGGVHPVAVHAERAGLGGVRGGRAQDHGCDDERRVSCHEMYPLSSSQLLASWGLTESAGRLLQPPGARDDMSVAGGIGV